MMLLGLFQHNFAMNYISLYEVNCEDTSKHYPVHYCGSSSHDKYTITKKQTMHFVIWFMLTSAVPINLVA